MLIQHSNDLEWWVVRCGSKKGHQEDTCFEEIRLHVQNKLNHSMLNSQHSHRELYDHSISMRIVTLIMSKIFI